MGTTVASRPGRRTRDKRDPEATRRALLDAGARLFPRRGYSGTSVEELARRARVNRALISYHFGGKRGLYVAVLESAFAEMADRLLAIEDQARDAREGLHGFLETFEAMTRERRDFPALFLRQVLSGDVEPAVVPHLVKIVGITRRLVERGRREGLFRRVDPLLFHFGLVGALGFFFATEPARSRASGRVPFPMPTSRSFVRHIEEMTLRGLAPDISPRTTRVRKSKRKGARS